MSYDFYQAANRRDKEKGRTSLVFQLSEADHEALFSLVNFNFSEVPFFSRIKDYYKDASYETEAIPTLMEELRALIQKNMIPGKTAHVIRQLLSVCEKALLEKKNIYCFCD